MNFKQFLIGLVVLSILVPGALLPGDGGEAEDNGKTRISTAVAFGLDLSQGNTNALGLNADFNIDWKLLEKTELQCSASISYLEVDDEKRADKMFLQLLLDHLMSRKITFFLLAKTSRNLLQAYEFRMESGGGFKYDIIDNFSNGKDILHTDLSLSAAVVYELTNFLSQEDQKVIRLSIRPRIKQQLSKNLQFHFMLFYQPALDNFHDYRVLIDSRVEFIIAKSVSYVLKFLSEFNSLVPEDVRKQDYRLINQLSLNF